MKTRIISEKIDTIVLAINRMMRICAIFFMCQCAFAQQSVEDSLLAHYQLEIGNAWDYTGGSTFLGIFFYPKWKFVTATQDSIHHNGQKFVVLEQVTFNMEGPGQHGSLGQIRKDIYLQRIDSTSLNVYQVDPFDYSNSTAEFLVDSLKAKQGDSIFTHRDYGVILQLFEVSDIELWGRQRTLRRVATVNALVGYQFTTVTGIGEVSRLGGEGSIWTDALSGAIIQNDTLGALKRHLKPNIRLSQQRLHFNKELLKNTLFIINDGAGLAIVDSVTLADESRFFSQPYYHGLGYAYRTFSKGPFLVFPKDSIFLDIFLRDSTLSQALQDTFVVFASSTGGEHLPQMAIPVAFDPTVSIRNPAPVVDHMPKSYQLKVYPNPVIQSQDMHISFRLFESERVKIQIYDVTGKTIMTLIDEIIPSGEHRRVWQTQKLAAGTYFVQIKTRQRIETTKIKILK